MIGIGLVLGVLALLSRQASAADIPRPAWQEYGPDRPQFDDYGEPIFYAEEPPPMDALPPQDAPAPPPYVATHTPSAVPLPPSEPDYGAEFGSMDDTQAGGVNLDAIKGADAPGTIATALAIAFQPGGTFEPLDNPNVQAFLAMIGYSEGADYQTLFGGGTFESYADHPRTVIHAGGYASSAAGKYQFLRKTWDDVAPRIGATDFSPYWQDRAAVFLLKRRGALADVIAGRFAEAIAKVRKEWASLPGAGYGQPERSFERLRTAYLNAGGAIASV